MTREEARREMIDELEEFLVGCGVKGKEKETAESNPDFKKVYEANIMAIQALKYDDAKYHEEHGEVVVDKAVWEDAKRALGQEPSDDCVSRAHLISKLEILDRRYGSDFYWETRKIVDKLPSVKPQPCEDAISRQAVLDAVDKVCRGSVEYRVIYDRCEELIKAIPSAEPKTGHWIEKDGFDGDVYYDCSECGDSWTMIEGTSWDNEFKYCPSCGAKMVEPQEISDRNLKMWHDIYAEEKRRMERSDKE